MVRELCGEVSRLLRWLPFVFGSLPLGLWVPYATLIPSAPLVGLLEMLGDKLAPTALYFLKLRDPSETESFSCSSCQGPKQRALAPALCSEAWAIVALTPIFRHL